MPEAQDRVTRVAADQFDSAAARGRRQCRPAKQQLDHWARVGRAVSSQHSASRRRVEAALSGSLSMTDLTVEEGVVFNAEIAAGIEEDLARVTLARSWPSGTSPRSPSTMPVVSSSTDPMAPRPSLRADPKPASPRPCCGWT